MDLQRLILEHAPHARVYVGEQSKPFLQRRTRCADGSSVETHAGEYEKHMLIDRGSVDFTVSPTVCE